MKFLCLRPPYRLDFIRRSGHLQIGRSAIGEVDMQTRTMQADAETEKTFGALQDCVGQAGRVTPQLMTAVLDAVHAHSAIAHRAHQAERIRRLIDAAAWTEAALAIAEFDRLRAVRRITHEDGEWCCTVGSQWPVPDWLDETIVFSHELLPDRK